MWLIKSYTCGMKVGVRMRVLIGIKRESECECGKSHNICKCIYNEYTSVNVNIKTQRSN